MKASGATLGMKLYKSILIAVSFFLAAVTQASKASACPDLTGTYFCQANSAHPEMFYMFAQTPSADGWIYNISSELTTGVAFSDFTFVAAPDVATAREQEVIDLVSGNKLKLVASCDSKALTVNGFAALNKPKPIRFSEILSIDPEGNLNNISLDINGNTVQETCFRQ